MFFLPTKINVTRLHRFYAKNIIQSITSIKSLSLQDQTQNGESEGEELFE